MIPLDVPFTIQVASLLLRYNHNNFEYTIKINIIWYVLQIYMQWHAFQTSNCITFFKLTWLLILYDNFFLKCLSISHLLLTLTFVRVLAYVKLHFKFLKIRLLSTYANSLLLCYTAIIWFWWNDNWKSIVYMNNFWIMRVMKKNKVIRMFIFLFVCLLMCCFIYVTYLLMIILILY